MKFKRKNVLKTLEKCVDAMFNESCPCDDCPFVIEDSEVMCGVNLIVQHHVEPDDKISPGSYEETFLAMASIDHMMEK